jgi:predicted small metal-binding protein
MKVTDGNGDRLDPETPGGRSDGRGTGIRGFRCRDVGFDCDFATRAPSEAEILRRAAEHARIVHGVAPLPEELVARVRTAIRDG